MNITVNEDSVTLTWPGGAVTIGFQTLSQINGLVAKEVLDRESANPKIPA